MYALEGLSNVEADCVSRHVLDLRRAIVDSETAGESDEAVEFDANHGHKEHQETSGHSCRYPRRAR